MGIKKSVLFLIFLMISYPVFALAQNISEKAYFSQEDQLKNIENTKTLSATEKTSTQNSFFQFNDGLWLNTSDTVFRDIYHEVLKDPVSSSFAEDMRIWGNLTFAQKNSIYIRVKDTYSFNHVSADYIGPATGYDNNGPHLDMGYLSLASDTTELKIGRQYLSVGNGIAYSDINDGVKLRKVIGCWILKGFAAQSTPHEIDIDTSVPGYDKNSNKRNFYGFELGYAGIPKLVPYIYYLVQRDHSTTNPTDPTQGYRYNSQYLGFGLNGFINNHFSYWLEGIKENGMDFNDASSDTDISLSKEKINAYAADLGVKYKFETMFNPISQAEFAYGSGDKNRANPTNTIGGNNNKIDTNFLYFGNYYGGYALSPRLSNLLIYKLEQSFNPLDHWNTFKDLTIGGKYFIYVKDKSSAGISDIESLQPHSFVGTEYDLYANWAINKHLFILLRYGEFSPGNTFSSDAKAHSRYYLLETTIAF